MPAGSPPVSWTPGLPPANPPLGHAALPPLPHWAKKNMGLLANMLSRSPNTNERETSRWEKERKGEEGKGEASFHFSTKTYFANGKKRQGREERRRWEKTTRCWVWGGGRRERKASGKEKRRKSRERGRKEDRVDFIYFPPNIWLLPGPEHTLA